METVATPYKMRVQRALLDPRTKLLLLLLIAVFCLAGFGGPRLALFRAVLTVLPFCLMLFNKRTIYGFVLLGLLLVSNAYLMFWYTGSGGTGEALLLVMVLLATRLLPCLMMGSYTMTTTTVSQFSAAMNRMHVPKEIVIPFSVMFRFFPTIAENARNIRESMRMRGVKGNGLSKFVEYRLVPLVEVTSRSGDELSASALVRGLGAPMKRTDIARIGFGVADAVVCALLVVALAASLVVSA